MFQKIAYFVCLKCKFQYAQYCVVYGGANMSDQMRELDRVPLRVITPGRLVDFLKHGKISLEYCK